MPTYDVLVQLDISFPGGTAKGNGNSAPPTVGTHFQGAGYEFQMVQIYCKEKCSDATVKKLAIAEARKSVVRDSAKYDFVGKGLIVKTVSATITRTNP